jgi:Rrf2 family transcriptional regulator, nitric oxide-sensitive transcriptional repressor
VNVTDHTDLGLRALMLLAVAYPERVAASDIAERHAISYTHVQKVVQSLQAAGLVDTFRGRGGGVVLARPASEIRVGEVVRALEPHFYMAECFRPETPKCKLFPGCALTAVLDRGKEAMLAELDRHTLADVVAGTPRTRTLL